MSAFVAEASSKSFNLDQETHFQTVYIQSTKLYKGNGFTAPFLLNLDANVVNDHS